MNVTELFALIEKRIQNHADEVARKNGSTPRDEIKGYLLDAGRVKGILEVLPIIRAEVEKYYSEE